MLSNSPYVLFLALFFPLTKYRHEIQRISLSGFAQGTSWHVTYYAQDSLVSKHQLDSLLNRLDSSLSIYKPYSLISRFNASSDGILVDDYLSEVVDKAIEVWKISGGLFDITIQPLVQAWGFSAKPVKKFPGKRKVRSLLRCTGTDKIKLEGRYLSKTKPCIAIDVDGIAQGYSVDVVSKFLDEKNVQNYIVEIGGEIRLKGSKQPGEQQMKIGIESPGYDQQGANVLQKIIVPAEGAITTSGNYRKYHESNGKKFSHTIDPRTGYPTENNLISVTVYAQDAITADAYDNVLMAMGLDKALSFTEAHPEIAAYFIYKDTDGNIRDTASSRFIPFFEE